jgi:SAM-dependent methyltransferase
LNPQFDAYAAYYDLLYRAKPYAREAAYVDGLIREHAPGARSLLELGSGTGLHAIEFARLGYEPKGIDLSPGMVELARKHAAAAGMQLEFEVHDIRSYQAQAVHDVVLSLFHVMSYQTTNADVQAAMRTATDALAPGGLFVFDCWYGPGVLSNPPHVRIFRAADAGMDVLRISEPTHFSNLNRVDVAYEIIVTAGGNESRIRELHSMRYFFQPEMQLFLSHAGFELVAAREWLGDAEPAATTWNAVFVARKL